MLFKTFVSIDQFHSPLLNKVVVGKPPLNNSMKVKYGVVVGKFAVAPVIAKGAISCVAVV
jgi:hypothetical protein